MHATDTERLGHDRRAGSRQLAANARALDIGRAGRDAYVGKGFLANPQYFISATRCAVSGRMVRTL